jgi:hypothetical protein
MQINITMWLNHHNVAKCMTYNSDMSYNSGLFSPLSLDAEI